MTIRDEEVHLVTRTTLPNFFRPCNVYSSSDWSRARSFAKVILNNRAVVFCYLLQTNKTVRRLPCLSTTIVLRDVLIVAIGVHVIVVLTWRHL